MTLSTLPSLKAVPLLGILLAGAAGAAQAQTLTLSPATSAFAIGSTVTYSVILTGGTSVGGYDINTLIDPSQVQFVGAFTNTDATDFSFQVVNGVSPTNAGDLEYAYTQPLSGLTGVTPTGPLTLGTFQVKILTALPAGGSPVAFGPINAPGALGGSEVNSSTSPFPNELKSATGAALFTPAAVVPEGPPFALLGLGLLPLGLLAVRRRRA